MIYCWLKNCTEDQFLYQCSVSLSESDSSFFSHCFSLRLMAFITVLLIGKVKVLMKDYLCRRCFECLWARYCLTVPGKIASRIKGVSVVGLRKQILTVITSYHTIYWSRTIKVSAVKNRIFVSHLHVFSFIRFLGKVPIRVLHGSGTIRL